MVERFVTLLSPRERQSVKRWWDLLLIAILAVSAGCAGTANSTGPGPQTKFALSGSITPGASGNGATLTLSGAGAATVTADVSGNFTFAGLGPGAYTVTPSKSGMTFDPPSQGVIIAAADVTGVSFTAASTAKFSISGSISPVSSGGGATVSLSGAADASTTADSAGNFSFPNLSNGNYVITPAKSGFTFSPSSKSVTVNGADSTGVTFTASPQTNPTFSISGNLSGAGGAGATITVSGSSSGTATADAAGSFTLGGLANGNYTVTPSKSGFTFSPASKAVIINGADQTGINFASAGITFSISGTISGAGGNGATVTLSGAANVTATANAAGVFTFSGLANGSYTVIPSKAGFTFSPASQSVTISGADSAAVNFSSAAQTFSISGSLSPLTGGAGATLALSGAASSSTTSSATGAYSFGGLASGNYVVTPSNTGFTFSPASQTVTLGGANVTNVNFTASASAPTFSISGSITPASAGAGASVALTGPAAATVTADASGNFTFAGLGNGSYIVTPTSTTATFSPATQSVTINGADVSGVSFTATATSSVVFFDDFTASSLDTTTWVALDRAGDYSNGESQCYKPANVQLSGGSLVETFQAQTVTCGDQLHPASSWSYTSAMVQWKSFDFLYGTVEVRAKIPNTTLWPAIWMLGSNCQLSNPATADNVGSCNWPVSGSDEIDIAEFAPNDASSRENSFSNSSQSGSSTNSFSCGSGPQVGGDGKFHVFTFSWSATKLTWAVDGNVNCTTTNSNIIPTKPMFLLMNIAANNSAVPAGLPQTLNVDYVKVTKP